MPARHRSPEPTEFGRSLVASARLIAILIATVAAPLAGLVLGGPRAAAESRIEHGVGASGIQISNLSLGPGTDAANVSADFHRQDGFGPITASAAGIPSGGAWHAYLGGAPELRPGIYDAIAYADRSIRSSVRTDWLRTGAVMMYTSSSPAEELVAPLVRIEAAGHRSLITVQNTDQEAAIEYEIALFEMGGSGVSATARFTVAARLSRTIDLAHEPAFEGLRDAHPDGFVGSARIRSAGTPMTAHVATEGEPGSIGVYDYPVEPAPDRAETLHIPRFRVHEPGLGGSAGTRSTSVTVGNSSPAIIDVTAVYTGTGGTCVGRVVETGPHTVSPWSSRSLDAALDAGFERGCFGYATLISDGPASAVVVDRIVRADRPTAYSAHPAVSARDASAKVLVPLLQNRYLPGYEVTTETIVTNPGREPATVTLVPSYSDGVHLPGPCSACEFTLAPHESRSIEAAELGYPEGAYGSASVSADRPVAVVDHAVSLTGARDALAFRGHTLPLHAPAGEHLPLVVHHAEFFGPSAASGIRLYFPAALRNVR